MGIGTTAKVFVREATGLVRERSWVDLMFLNVVAFGGAWSIIYALTYTPFYGGDPAFSLLLTAPGILALLGVYYVFNTSMPRSGGDYVYTSRVLHPSLGLAANFVGVTMFLWFWIADAASVFQSFGLVQTLSVYGTLTNSQWAFNVVNWLKPAWNNFLVGSVVIIGFAAFVILNSRIYFRIQNVLMTIAVLGLVTIIGLLAVAVVNPSIFVSNFNAYALKVQGPPNAYDAVAAAGSPPDTSLSNIANLQVIPLWFTVLFWVYYSSYLGGETRQVRSTAKRALFGAFGIVFLSALFILELSYKALGTAFLSGASGIYYGAPNISPSATIPNLTLFAAVLANNPALVLFLGIGVVAGFILVVPNSIITFSRNLFAYSFDNLTPRRVASVDDRFHAPVWAVAVAVIGGEVMLAFLSGIFDQTNTSYSSTAFTLYTYAGLGTVSATFLFIGLAAILFPYRRKQLYETSSTVKRKIAGVPVITWLGLITFAYSFATIFLYTTNQTFYLFGCPAGGAVACLYNNFVITLSGVFIATIAYYFLVRWYKSRKGVPIDLAFKEIPPE